jgi:hypothetical protein
MWEYLVEVGAAQKSGQEIVETGCISFGAQPRIEPIFPVTVRRHKKSRTAIPDTNCLNLL